MLLETIDLTKRFSRSSKLWQITCDDCKSNGARSYNQIKSSEERYAGLHICKSCAIARSNKNKTVEEYQRAGAAGSLAVKGKKLVDIVGAERSKELKRFFSNRSSGKNNANYGGKYSRGFHDKPLTGKWEDTFGEEKAKAMKLNMSLHNSGSGNPMFGKPTPKKSGNGISGHYGAHYFRSLLELSAMLLLDQQGILWEGAEAAQHRIPYELEGRSRTYTPDIYFPETNSYWELKPSSLIHTKEVTTKMEAARLSGINVELKTERDIMKINREDLLVLIEQGKVMIDTSKQRRVANEA